jgi:hypothetical protein
VFRSSSVSSVASRTSQRKACLIYKDIGGDISEMRVGVHVTRFYFLHVRTEIDSFRKDSAYNILGIFVRSLDDPN